MNTWKLSKIEITYPSINTIGAANRISKFKIKYYALTCLYFNYNNFELQFSFDLTYNKIFALVDFSNKKNPNILEEKNFSELKNILIEYKLPNFNPILSNDQIEYLIFENDDDGNNNYETNVELIKSGDYGYPNEYESNFLLNDYEYTTNLETKRKLEDIILNNLKENLTKYIL
jgi:hypothetical protein